MHAFGVGFGDHSGKVLIALKVPGEQRLVVDLMFGKLPWAQGPVFRQVSDIIGALGLAFGAIRHLVVIHQIDFASDDRFDPFFLSAVVEINGPKKVAMIGHRDCRHLQFRASGHEAIDATASIEETIISMKVKVNKRGVGRHGWFLEIALKGFGIRESAERGVESNGFDF